MKKLIILLLVFSLLSLTSCGLLKKVGLVSDVAADICEIANNSNPTKVTTEVSFTTNQGDSLSGYYVTTTDGTTTIFDYYYEKLATPEESLQLGNSDRIIKSEGSVTYKDGAYYDAAGDAWKPGTGTAFDLRFNIDQDLLKDVVVSEDGYSFEAKVSPEDLVSIIGTNLNATGDATLTVETNGTNLTIVTVSCTTANGSLTVRTSYTYNKHNLSETEG